MSKYCPECGNKLDDSDEFCSECGNKFNENTSSNNSDMQKYIIIGLIAVIIVLLLSVFVINLKTATNLTIESDSTLTTSDNLIVKLTADEKPLNNKKIRIILDKNGILNEFNVKTNSKGIAKIKPNVDVGNYEVMCQFEGDDKYSQSSANISLIIEEAEPDYLSYTPIVSFGETDKNNDGYILLSDMNMPHTPVDAQNRIFSDSDDDHDGKLNYYEYHKFMYKLNYERPEYGLDDVKLPF